MFDIIFISGELGRMSFPENEKDFSESYDSFIRAFEDSEVWDIGETDIIITIKGHQVDVIDFSKVLGYKYS